MIKNRCSSLCLRQLQVLGYSHLIHLKSSLGLRPLSLSLLWRIPLLLFVASGTYPCCFSIRSNAAFCSALKNGLIRLRLLFHLPRFLPFCCLPALVFMLVKGNIVRHFLHSFLVLMIFRCCLSRLITLIFESWHSYLISRNCHLDIHLAHFSLCRQSVEYSGWRAGPHCSRQNLICLY